MPTLAIGYGLVIPRSCIAGVKELSVGFGSTVLGAVLTYFAGIRTATATSCPVRVPTDVETVVLSAGFRQARTVAGVGTESVVWVVAQR
jgi:hypothetical protein